MRLTTLPALQIVCCILLLASCVLAVPKIKPLSNEDNIDSEKKVSEEKLEVDDKLFDDEIPKNHRKQLDDEIDLDDAFDAERIRDEQIPILPPIILLDFVNGTDDTNSTLDGDEKSKRTIDGSLGYGYDRNSFFSGKHNFYLPGGKGATSVSIVESISPFEPKTVYEIEKPITENSDADIAHEKQKSRKTLLEQMPKPLPLQTGRDPVPLYPPFPMYGQRTKLHKTSSSEFNKYSQRPQTKYTSSFSSTPNSEIYNKLITTFTSVKPTNHHASSASYSNQANIQNYARPITPSYMPNYMQDYYGSGSSQKSTYNFQPNPISSETPMNPQSLANYPRYTYENGVKYEHKIVWKYPDGRVSEVAPTSYVNSYSEYNNAANTANIANTANAANAANIANTAYTGGFRPSQPYQPRPIKSQQYTPSGTPSYNQYTATASNNIHSQRPVQFPSEQEKPSNQPKPQSQFVSSPSTNTSPAQSNSPSSSYNLQSYQGQYGLKQQPKVSNYRPAQNQNDQFSAYQNNYQPASTYSVNSPSTEYSYSAGSQSTDNLFMPDGQLNKQVLAKYSPQAQEYLTKVFANGKSSSPSGYQNDETKNFPNSDYSSLLNYNPSISQYIKNPASILKAQPTFIQAGDSLVPVIILRVDGAPPVSSQSNPNINLKSLLRQYLTQYANNVSKGVQNANYNLESSIDTSEVSVPQSNPVHDLRELTETLASLRQRTHQEPDFADNLTPEYPQASQPIQQQSSEIGQEYSGPNYSGYYQTYSEQQVKEPKKVKSVQIVEDPRYTSYKVEN